MEQKTNKPVKINLGCGKIMLPDYINADILGGDMTVDLMSFPWPFPDNYADEILMAHCLEHLPDTYRVMGEISRILKKGGKFRGTVPYAFSEASFMHPQHYRFFTEASFGILAESFPMKVNYARLGSFNNSTASKLRNCIPRPIRMFLRHFILNCFSFIDFEMERI